MVQEAIRISEIQEKNHSFNEIVNKLSYQKQKHNTLKNSFDLNNQAALFEGDCMKLLEQIPNNSINLIITSPPYNIGKEYEKNQILINLDILLYPIFSELKMKNRVFGILDMDYMLQKDSLEDMKLLCGLVKPTIITLT